MSPAQGDGITVALQPAFLPTSSRVGSCRILPFRPRRIADADHAARVLELAPTNRDVLPRWGINSPIRDHGAAPGAYTGTIGWTSRQHYLTVTVPAALLARPEVLQGQHVEPATFLRWIRAKSLYSQDRRSGRSVIVRPDTIAHLMQASLSTVHRCQRAARQLGLEQVILMGRMLSEIEVKRARKNGSPQRGLSTISAFTIPAWLQRPVCHDTPSRGGALSAYVKDFLTFNHTEGRSKGAPLRSAPRQRTRSPAWALAKDLTDQALFLRRCPPGRIAGQLRRYQTVPRPWRAVQILRAMDAVNVRLGYTAPVRPKQSPWGLLSWYLRQIDPVADHPDFEGAFAPHAGAAARPLRQR